MAPPCPTNADSGTTREERDVVSMESTDAELVVACRAGDARAWRLLVERHEALVYSIPRRLGFDQSTSEDVFQEVFAALVSRIGSLRNPQGLAKWLMTTTLRVSRRTRIRVSSPIENALLLASDDAPPDVLEGWERAHHLRQALDGLGPACRDLLLALYGRGDRISYEQVAARLGMPVGSIGPTRARCLARLIELMNAAGRCSSDKRVSGSSPRSHPEGADTHE